MAQQLRGARLAPAPRQKGSKNHLSRKVLQRGVSITPTAAAYAGATWPPSFLRRSLPFPSLSGSVLVPWLQDDGLTLSFEHSTGSLMSYTRIQGQRTRCSGASSTKTVSAAAQLG